MDGCMYGTGTKYRQGKSIKVRQNDAEEQELGG